MTDRDRAAFAAVKVGDLFVEHWGYDETRATFYRVVGKTKARIKVVKVEDTYDGDAAGPCAFKVPTAVARWDSPVKTKAVRASWDGEPAFAASEYSNAYRWDGKPVMVTGPHYGR